MYVLIVFDLLSRGAWVIEVQETDLTCCVGGSCGEQLYLDLDGKFDVSPQGDYYFGKWSVQYLIADLVLGVLVEIWLCGTLWSVLWLTCELSPPKTNCSIDSHTKGRTFSKRTRKTTLLLASLSLVPPFLQLADVS